MATNEEFLLQKFGRERHFDVPQGYFAQFNVGMVDQIRATKAEVVQMRHRSVWHNVVCAAACLLAAVVMTAAYFHADHLVDGVASLDKDASVSASADAIDQAADYMMLDEADLYAYMEDF